MSPRRSSSRTQQPAQRRPRTEKACNFCRIAKQRCEPIEYGTTDRPCRRCVAQGLDCNIPRAARSQSPGSGFGAQLGPGPVRHPVAPHSAGGATDELTPGTEEYTLQQSEPIRVPMGRWSPLMMRPEERQGPSTTIHSPGQNPLQTPNFLHLAPSMEGYQQSFSNVAQGWANPEPGYYPQEYYGQTTSSSTYMASYATRSASDDAPNLGYVIEESQPDNAGAFANEQDASPSRSSES